MPRKADRVTATASVGTAATMTSTSTGYGRMSVAKTLMSATVKSGATCRPRANKTAGRDAEYRAQDGLAGRDPAGHAAVRPDQA